ncbi:hypothetical protein GLOTRDRAFT_141301 [Gloeophyllum trabeum ATCC 11539]|uniref:Cation efflux protein n=1 Tax=Gloeophyllum trabeum (strain ATCC 11539 / FP-39264 / Madison 617) TaxID=670483 RepID=S7PTX2_GLOTA|nr:uncharacterized protein GLOTRDRAFT_141301 [Gloeophyllum trabeum ATCC 11539]EPQ50787.1 hypothetical protein GLOTRDRAFT_141301 [Gloeophyllum trabeum ATCC 11539]
MHRRKSSHEDVPVSNTEHTVSLIGRDGSNSPKGIHPGATRNVQNDMTPPRLSVNSTPLEPPPGFGASQFYPNLPPSAGPFRTSFSFNSSANATNGNGAAPPSPLRASFSKSGHSRTRSTSGPYASIVPSPLSPSFSSQSVSSSESFSFPQDERLSQSSSSSSSISGPSIGAPPKNYRRHSRINSRNLSIFFPRPGALPQQTILEDGAQELEYDIEPQGVPLPSMESAPTLRSRVPEKLGEGFTFGARPPSQSDEQDEPHLPASATHPMTAMSSRPSKRGHHHRHSLSHNFFSFLEPGAEQTDLQTNPTPMPASPWNPVSPFSSAVFPKSAQPTQTSFEPSASEKSIHQSLDNTLDLEPRHVTSAIAILCTAAQFLLGAWMWVRGQQVGSLACTGMGYWVVFDAFGLGLGQLLPAYLSSRSMQAKIRRPYGNARIETVLLFAQAIYLMFSAVYVCKETVEHLLLSVGEEGHHHHVGDETAGLYGIEFPVFTILSSVASLTGSALLFNNHAKLVNVAGNYLPPMSAIVRSALSRYPMPSSYTHPLPTNQLGILLSNPYALSPILSASLLLVVVAIVPSSQHQSFDLLLSSLETIMMFRISYRACVALGAVLLQTAPERGLPGGRMEAFLRTMREMERHPEILHLPAPHIWQLTAPLTRPSTTTSKAAMQSLVVTLELHVKKDISDREVVELTRWAWEKCESALAVGTSGSRGEAEVEVTVGVVRG